MKVWTSLVVTCALAHAQSWQALQNQPAPTLGAALLLTDGSVMVQDNGPNNNGSPNWWKLTPGQTGSYVKGTWSKLAPMPSGYMPFTFSSAVLPDGRVVVMGGEYNGSGTPVESNKGAIYSPQTDTWTPVSAPAGWNEIGDSPNSVLPNGRFLLGNLLNTQLAELDPNALTWSLLSSANKADRNAEEGYTLLPDGSLLAVNVGTPPGAQRYVPSMGQWLNAGNTPQALTDVTSEEIGPAVLRPDGTVFATGATGHNAVYTPPATLTGSGSWKSAPDFPNIPGQGQLDVADGPAVLLPSGNVLVSASPGVYQKPNHFFEFDGTNLNEVTAAPNASHESSFYGRMLLLPTGQVLFFDTISTGQIYTPAGSPNPAWAPTITSAPSQINPGSAYSISGTQFNGLSQAVAYGDDYQAATNYPLVRITNRATGHVFYARTHDHSTMAVATGNAIVSSNFDVPNNIESGPSDLVVVANGIPSLPSPVIVAAPPAFFTGEALLSGGVFYLSFPNSNIFGYFTNVASSIFFHYDMGYEAFVPGSTADIYMYDFTSSHWWYTSTTLFPYLYDFTLTNWIYYFPDTKNPGHYATNPRYFSNLTTGKIFTM